MRSNRSQNGAQSFAARISLRRCNNHLNFNSIESLIATSEKRRERYLSHGGDIAKLSDLPQHSLAGKRSYKFSAAGIDAFFFLRPMSHTAVSRFSYGDRQMNPKH